MLNKLQDLLDNLSRVIHDKEEDIKKQKANFSSRVDINLNLTEGGVNREEWPEAKENLSNFRIKIEREKDGTVKYLKIPEWCTSTVYKVAGFSNTLYKYRWEYYIPEEISKEDAKDIYGIEISEWKNGNLNIKSDGRVSISGPDFSIAGSVGGWNTVTSTWDINMNIVQWEGARAEERNYFYWTTDRTASWCKESNKKKSHGWGHTYNNTFLNTGSWRQNRAQWPWAIGKRVDIHQTVTGDWRIVSGTWKVTIDGVCVNSDRGDESRIIQNGENIKWWTYTIDVSKTTELGEVENAEISFVGNGSIDIKTIRWWKITVNNGVKLNVEDLNWTERIEVGSWWTLNVDVLFNCGTLLIKSWGILGVTDEWSSCEMLVDWWWKITANELYKCNISVASWWEVKINNIERCSVMVKQNGILEYDKKVVAR